MPTTTGILELSGRGDGRLRSLDNTYVASTDDPVVPARLVDRFGLRPGVEMEVRLGKPIGGGGGGGQGGGGGGKRGRKRRRSKRKNVDPSARRVEHIEKVDGLEPGEYQSVRRFEDLTSIDPQPRLTLEHPGCPPAARLIDLFCPIGYGQRGMIVSPPKAGKTTILQTIATAVSTNHPEVEVVALLIDERPEEVTDFRRNVPCKVWASSNDHPPEKHVGLGILAIERAKRQAEHGKDVVILLDSLTRLGRAFNTAPGMQGTGRTLSGGLDAGALAIPKQLFGAARRFEEGGSLTIVATALVDTGSRGDQVIFEEFKGTGNMEMILDRKIAEQRVWPAIDLAASGTRKEHLLMSEQELTIMTALRRRLLNMQPVMQVEQLLRALDRFKTNADLVGNPQGPGSREAAVRS
ncbi:MAG: transcription termination factor Rho [Phycisphaeraceae bacterium]